MLSYQEFYKELTQMVTQQLGDDIEVECKGMEHHPGEKVVELVCYKKQRPQSQCGISAQKLYQLYCKDQDIARIADMVSQFFMHDFFENHTDELVEKITDWEWAKDRVILQLVNQQTYAEILKKSPHNAFADMATVVRVMVQMDKEGIQTTIVTNDMLKDYPVNKDELFVLAIENTKRIFPAHIISAEQIYHPCNQEDEISRVELYILTNELQLQGAIAMFYPNVLQDFAKSRNLSGFYIIPSSTTEVLIHVDEQSPREQLSEIMKEQIREVNQQLTKKDVLSENLYYYDAKHEGIYIL